MTLTIAKGERLTFRELFEDKNYDIEIPIIQRDYAQGRASSAEIREVFLDTLLSYLQENRPHRDLDFVYGSVEPDGKGGQRLIPLDGQQRLTTLFLLHWYLAALSGNQPAFRALLFSGRRSRFTYETRTSSREFCDALVAADIDMHQLLDQSVSATIRDKDWFYLSWNNDPTVRSMLTMLDSIDQKFRDYPEFYARLTDERNRVITFLMLPMQEFKLTDDLYIKMNSRGKPLSPFENFKAKFEQHIGELDWKKTSPYTIRFGDRDKPADRREYFSYRIDTAWSDLFWNYRDKTSRYSSFDGELMNLIRVVVSSAYALKKTDGKDETLEYLFGTNVVNRRPDYSNVITYHRYQKFGALSKRAVSLLIGTFDQLANGNGPIRIHLKDTFYFNEELVFKKVLDHSLSQEQRVQFYAYTAFLIEHEGNPAGLAQWMRVIHNLSVNTVIDSADEVARAMRSVKDLLPHSADILAYLTQIKATDVDFFYRRQVQEEQLKAHLILKTPEWRNAITAAEQHSYFLGQILFLFEFCGALDWFEKYGSCNWNLAEDTIFLTAFQQYAAKAGAVFDATSKDFAWERTVLTKGDYLPYLTAWRRNFMTTRQHRDYSWKRLLRLPPPSTDAAEAQHQAYQRSLVRQVLDDADFNKDDLQASLKTIRGKNKPADWRKMFILKPALIGYCSQGFIRYKTGADILLYKHSQQNHTQAELYTYDLWLREFEDKAPDLPFEKCQYREVRTGDEQAGIRFDGLRLGKKSYRLELLYQSEGATFELRFLKPEGRKGQEYYQPELVALLGELDFEWDEQDKYFWVLTDSLTRTMAKLRDLGSQAKALAEQF